MRAPLLAVRRFLSVIRRPSSPPVAASEGISPPNVRAERTRFALGPGAAQNIDL